MPGQEALTPPDKVVAAESDGKLCWTPRRLHITFKNMKKHACPDCAFCQFCSETRCNSCRGTIRKKKKLSTEEQIARFESLNPEDRNPSAPLFFIPPKTDSDK